MEQRVQEVFEELSSALQQSHLNVQKYNGTNLEHHAMSKEELTFMRTLTNELKSFNSMSEKFVREKKLTTSSNCKEPPKNDRTADTVDNVNPLKVPENITLNVLTANRRIAYKEANGLNLRIHRTFSVSGSEKADNSTEKSASFGTRKTLLSLLKKRTSMGITSSKNGKVAEYMYPDNGRPITIIPTCVINVTEFYGIECVPVAADESNKRVSTPALEELTSRMDDEKRNYRPHTGVVTIDEHVFVKRGPNMQRARIVSILDEGCFKVFHLDYGVCSTASLNENVYHWENWFDDIPFQAMHFQMADIVPARKVDFRAIAKFGNLINTKAMKASVCDTIPCATTSLTHSKTIVVRLYDNLDRCINSQLCFHKVAKSTL